MSLLQNNENHLWVQHSWAVPLILFFFFFISKANFSTRLNADKTLATDYETLSHRRDISVNKVRLKGYWARQLVCSICRLGMRPPFWNFWSVFLSFRNRTSRRSWCNTSGNVLFWFVNETASQCDGGGGGGAADSLRRRWHFVCVCVFGLLCYALHRVLYMVLCF